MSDTEQTGSDREHTHYCEDCEVELELLYDDRDGRDVPIVCGHCGGTNTHRLAMTDGGQPASATDQFSVLDATTGGKHIWHEEMEDADHVIFADRRKVPDGLEHQPSWECLPDVLCDFRRLPFADESFDLICFDPPHRVNDEGMKRLTGVLLKKYGALAAETWQADLRAGFDELWRVLRPGGTLTMKWADETKSHAEVLDLLDQTPHFGVTTEKKRAVVKWHLFHKPRKAVAQQTEDKPLVTDGGVDEPGSEQCERLLESIEVSDGWEVSWERDSLKINYTVAPTKRLKRKTVPGIHVSYIGSMWMLASGDSIGHGLGIEHAGILNHGKTVDCQHLDDAVAAVENGIERIEEAVGEELQEAHEVRGWPHA